jgi:hypothetical protein
MRRAIAIGLVAVGSAGAARAARADDVRADYVPAGTHVTGASVDFMPSGMTVYSGNNGEGDYDVEPAYGATAWFGWEPTEGFEIGAQLRYIAHEKIVYDTGTGSELIGGLRIAAHTRPWDKLDLAFVLAPGFSHVFVTPTTSLPDANGFTVDFALEASYPVARGLYGVFTLGYQRGFQETTEPSQIPADGMKPVPADWATDYLHVGLGLARRF